MRGPGRPVRGFWSDCGSAGAPSQAMSLAMSQSSRRMHHHGADAPCHRFAADGRGRPPDLAGFLANREPCERSGAIGCRSSSASYRGWAKVRTLNRPGFSGESGVFSKSAAGLVFEERPQAPSGHRPKPLTQKPETDEAWAVRRSRFASTESARRCPDGLQERWLASTVCGEFAAKFVGESRRRR